MIKRNCCSVVELMEKKQWSYYWNQAVWVKTILHERESILSALNTTHVDKRRIAFLAYVGKEYATRKRSHGYLWRCYSVFK